MKATKLTIRKVSLSADMSLDMAQVIEEVLLSAPPGGSSTEQLLKGAVVYGQLAAERKKHAGKDEWVWWLESEHHRTLCGAVDAMRWGPSSGDVRMAVVGFIQAIKSAKEEDVPLVQ